MNRFDSPRPVFAEDERTLARVDPHSSAEQLLAREGVFFLKDIAKILEIDPVKFKRRATEIEARGQSTWRVMGARKIWNHWIVRMKAFAPYYRKHFSSRVRRIPAEWDGNTLLEQQGVFYLADVCRFIPFSTNQLRYQAKQNPNARHELGVWKDSEIGAYLVDMKRFAPWIRRLWAEEGPSPLD